MQKINYGLIVSDFDGTLLKDDGTIAPSVKQAIAKYRENGGIFAISTGRMPKGILWRAKELGLEGAVSCCNGAIILDIQTEKILFQNTIPNATAVRICRKMEELQLHIHAYDLWEYYANMQDDALASYERAVGRKAKLSLDKPLSQLLEEKGMDVYKLLVMLDPKDKERVQNALIAERFEGCKINASAAYLVEANNASNSKGTALEFLANYYGVPIEKTLAVGDQQNDIEMIEKAGLGVAVKNADNALKAKADCVAPYTNNEGVVGKIIEKFGCAEE